MSSHLQFCAESKRRLTSYTHADINYSRTATMSFSFGAPAAKPTVSFAGPFILPHSQSTAQSPSQVSEPLRRRPHPLPPFLVSLNNPQEDSLALRASRLRRQGCSALRPPEEEDCLELRSRPQRVDCSVRRQGLEEVCSERRQLLRREGCSEHRSLHLVDSSELRNRQRLEDSLAPLNPPPPRPPSSALLQPPLPSSANLPNSNSNRAPSVNPPSPPHPSSANPNPPPPPPCSARSPRSAPRSLRLRQSHYRNSVIPTPRRIPTRRASRAGFKVSRTRGIRRTPSAGSRPSSTTSLLRLVPSRSTALLHPARIRRRGSRLCGRTPILNSSSLLPSPLFVADPRFHSLVPALAVGFPAVQNRIEHQTRQSAAHQARLSEIHTHLSDLSTTHSLTTSLRTLRATQTATALSSRLLALVAKVSALSPNRNMSVRKEEEELRVGLEAMTGEVEGSKGRANELWAGVGALKARKAESGGVEWAVADEEGLRKILEVRLLGWARE